MKGSLLIIFQSKHGYVKRYVDILGNALGCDAVPLDKLKRDMLGYDRILYIGPVHGGSISGFKKLAGYLDGIYKKLIVCGVGMLPFHQGTAARLKDTTISIEYERFIPVFYAQGGFDINELSRTEKLTISMMIRQLQSASVLSDDDTFILNAVKAPVDEVKTANIKPLIDFLDGKHVDEKLYSPPEEVVKESDKEVAG